jgi:hypothetical protein
MRTPQGDQESGFQAQVGPSKAAFDAVDLVLGGKVAEAEKLMKLDAQQALEAAERQFRGVVG